MSKRLSATCVPLLAMLLINLAVGGSGGDPDDTTQWPAYYDTDWVRVWQKGVSDD